MYLLHCNRYIDTCIIYIWHIPPIMACQGWDEQYLRATVIACFCCSSVSRHLYDADLYWRRPGRWWGRGRRSQTMCWLRFLWPLTISLVGWVPNLSMARPTWLTLKTSLRPRLSILQMIDTTKDQQREELDHSRLLPRLISCGNKWNLDWISTYMMREKGLPLRQSVFRFVQRRWEKIGGLPIALIIRTSTPALA